MRNRLKRKHHIVPHLVHQLFLYRTENLLVTAGFWNIPEDQLAFVLLIKLKLVDIMM